MTAKKQSRRGFIATSAVAASAISMTAQSYAKVPGANDTIRVGFLGVGGRCQQHIDVVLEMQGKKLPVAPAAVCDVWDGDPELGSKKGRGLYPSAKRCGLPEKLTKGVVTKDYREVLDNKGVDVVCIATPDHWHAKMAVDAMEAGKDVYIEKPMTKTIAEAQLMVRVAAQTGRVVTVGVQSMADPTWQEAYKYIAAGNIGHVLQGQTSYFRNYIGGQWRYYPLKADMTPKTIDWDMWLGHGFEVAGEKLGPTRKEMPFDRAVWAQWRCYWPFGGGMFTDLFVHQTTHLIAAMGVRYPKRVVGAGGIYLEYDGRDVPDVATVVADYDEGCQVMVSATMCNATQLGEVIRGRTGTIRFGDNMYGDYVKGFEVYGENIAGGPAKPMQGFGSPIHSYVSPKDQKKDPPGTYMLWEDFLAHVRLGEKDPKRRETLCSVELGAAAFTTVNMGSRSYREGKVLFWDGSALKPKEADSSWATQWESRSKKRGKPNQIIGWDGGDKGSTVTPPDYQKLEGPWIDDKEPTGGK